jgi:hypothetical protein
LDPYYLEKNASLEKRLKLADTIFIHTKYQTFSPMHHAGPLFTGLRMNKINYVRQLPLMALDGRKLKIAKPTPAIVLQLKKCQKR